jgi:hypothetical protein
MSQYGNVYLLGTAAFYVVFYSSVRHYGTSWRAAGSIPDVVNFLNLPNPSGRIRPKQCPRVVGLKNRPPRPVTGIS